ncbi:MAG: helix-turn-helix domain-containing protein [Anaerolineae bacterium]|nr:helix-turn-helix domain-containing protein [Anaerolineae bacterium]
MPGKGSGLTPGVRWLSLQDASRMLGVHPSTLRQWADAGKIHTVRTPGGHRRFAETDVRALLEPEPLEPAGIQLLVQSALGRARLEVSGGKISEQSWYKRFDETDKAEHRELGRKLLSLVMQYLAQPGDRQGILDEARALGRAYGERSVARNLRITESVSAFLYFQDFLMDGVRQMAKTIGQGANIDLVAAYQQIGQFTNEVLLAMLEVYEKAA